MNPRHLNMPIIFILALAACDISISEDEKTPQCIAERDALARYDRRRGALITRNMENVIFGHSYTRRELVARYILHRSNSIRETPNNTDLNRAEKLILSQSAGYFNPNELIVAEPCMLLEIIPPKARPAVS